MNWKLRLQNKATLIGLIAGIVPFVYLILGWFGVTPKVAQSDIMQGLSMALNILVLLGVVVDPTTDGVGDSTLAMTYEEPRYETVERDDDDRSDNAESEVE